MKLRDQEIWKTWMTISGRFDLVYAEDSTLQISCLSYLVIEIDEKRLGFG